MVPAKPRRDDGLITASEFACDAYCPEQWRFQYGLGLAPQNQAGLAAGDRHHAGKTRAERVAGLSIVLGQAVVIFGVLLAVLWLGVPPGTLLLDFWSRSHSLLQGLPPQQPALHPRG